MILEFVPFPLIFSIIFLTIFVVILIARKNSVSYLFFFSLFWVYLSLVVSLTLFPIPIGASIVPRLSRQSIFFIFSRVNLIPFDYSQFKNLDPTSIFIREVVENILLTIPFGFLINFTVRSKIRKIPLMALAVSISIELAQLVMCLLVGLNYRGIDINDAMMNMLGVLCGYGCFCLFSRLFLKLTERLQIGYKGLFGYVYLIAKRSYPTR